MGALVKPTVSDDDIDAVLVSIRMGLEPVEACQAAGVPPMLLWHTLLQRETYARRGALDQLTNAQRRALILGILHEPAPKEGA